MLSYKQAYELLNRYGKDAAWTRHCVAVARVAERVSCVLDRRLADARLLRVGALLHDIGRYKTQDPVLHGVEGYRLLSRLGYDREAFICASHVLFGMPRREAILYGLPDQDFIPETLEERLVPLIDSVVEFDRPTTLAQRFSSISRRYKNSPDFLKRFEQSAQAAASLLQFLRTEFCISLEQVAIDVLGAGT